MKSVTAEVRAFTAKGEKDRRRDENFHRNGGSFRRCQREELPFRVITSTRTGDAFINFAERIAESVQFLVKVKEFIEDPAAMLFE